MNLADCIRNVPDFPKPGIQFKDITTLLLVPDALREVTRKFRERYETMGIDAIVGVDARGFVFGGALAHEMNLPLVLARKPGKLPADTVSETYALEYGEAVLEIHQDGIRPGQRMLIMDDLLATGGTVGAVAKMVRRLGGEPVEAAFVVELPPLNGRKNLADINLPVFSLVEFMVD